MKKMPTNKEGASRPIENKDASCCFTCDHPTTAKERIRKCSNPESNLYGHEINATSSCRFHSNIKKR